MGRAFNDNLDTARRVRELEDNREYLTNQVQRAHLMCDGWQKRIEALKSAQAKPPETEVKQTYSFSMPNFRLDPALVEKFEKDLALVMSGYRSPSWGK